MMDTINCKNRAGWLQERQKRVGASESHQLFLGQAFALWAAKVRPPLTQLTTEEMLFGQAIEPVVRQMFAHKFGGKVSEWPQYRIAIGEHPNLHATPDGFYECKERDGKGTLQIKTASEFRTKELAEEIPLSWQIQCQHEMAVTDAPWSVLAILVGRRTQRVFVDRNERFIEALRIRVAAFWDFVVQRRQPPADASPETAKALARLHPESNGRAIWLPETADNLLGFCDLATETRKEAKRDEDEIKNQLRAWIGDNSWGVTPSGRVVSWKSQERKEYTVPASSIRVLRTSGKLPDGIEVEGERPTIEAQPQPDLSDDLKLLETTTHGQE